MKCNVCREDVKQLDKQAKAHVLVSKDNEGHFHVHGDRNRRNPCNHLFHRNRWTHWRRGHRRTRIR